MRLEFKNRDNNSVNVSLGVGSLSSPWVQRNIDEVVLDDLHILCYDTWSELVKWARDKDVQGRGSSSSRR